MSALNLLIHQKLHDIVWDFLYCLCIEIKKNKYKII